MKTPRLLTFFTLFFLLGVTLQAATRLQVSTRQLTPESTITIVFERAVVKDEQIHQASSAKWLKISPNLPGTLFWKSANVAEFHPRSAPLMGTTYTFSIAKGHHFRDGSPLPSGTIGKTTSESFRVTNTSRLSKSTKHTRQPAYYVSFNDAVTPETAERFVFFKNKENVRIAATVRRATWGNDVKSIYRRGETWQARFKAAQSGKKNAYDETSGTPIPNAIVIKPVAPLPVGDGWELHISKQLTNASNNAVHLGGRNIWLGDIEPFELEEINAYVEANQPRQIHITFNSLVDPELKNEQLAKLISLKPALENARFKVLGQMIIIDGDLRKHDEWKVSLSSTIRSKNALELGADSPHKIIFKTVPTGLALPGYDSAQYAMGNRLYGIDTVNLSSVRIRIKQLTPDKAVRTMQGYQHYKGSGHNGKNLSPTYPMPYALIDGTTVYDRTIPLDNPIDTSKEIRLDWKKILKNPALTTTLFVSVEGTAREDVEDGDRIAQAFVQLTDIGLCWKLSEKEALIYAFSCQTGQPLPGVTLQVFNDDAQPADKTTTDTNGIAHIPRNTDARHLRATLANDCYIIPFDNTLDTVALWRFPVDMEWNHLKGWKRSVMMFTDRNLYRPGETVQLKGIVRRFLDNQIELTPGKSARLTITDATSRVLYDKKITLSKHGTFDHTLKLPPETVGRFTAKLTFPEDPSQADKDSWLVNQYRIFRHTFHVQEFRRNAFEITSSIPPSTPGAAQITLNLASKYYQGQPVKEGLVSWHFKATQTGFYPEKFRDYLFGDHRKYDAYYWSHYFGYGNGYGHSKTSDRNGEGRLDADGKLSLSYDLPKLTFPTALAVNIHSEITDTRDQTLSRSSSTTVHPADTYVGISRIDRLIRVGESPKLEVVAVDTQGEQRKNPVTVTAVIERKFNDAVKIQSPDGKTSVNNTEHTEKVAESTITITPGHATTLSFTPSHTGDHTITLSGTDKDGHVFQTVTSLHVYGTDEYPWAVEDGMKIKLVPEKKQYRPGDTARILVMTPIEGTALVTVERSGVHREFRRELKASDPVIEVPLTDMDAPNAYVSVLIIRGADASPRKAKEPALKLGYCTLHITNVKDRLAVNLTVEGSQHRPAEPTTISGKVTRSDGSPASDAEVVLYAEDEGTLAVMGYQTPDPMKAFHAPRPLLVQCGTSFSTFIPEKIEGWDYGNKGFTIGGGEDDPFGSRDIDLKSRSDFNPCAVWKPALHTDAQGKFSATFTNPDTLTRYRVIAVAMESNSRFGSASTDYTVDQPIMLEPAAPRYASEGDHLYPKVLVQNNSTFEGSWEISLATTSTTYVGKQRGNRMAKKTVTLKPGGVATVYFDVTFGGTGTARWTWSARPITLKGQASIMPALARDLSDRAESSFDVTFPAPLMHQLRFVTMNNTGQHDMLSDLDPKLLNGRGHIDLTLSNSLLLEAGEAVDFLLHYPYGCLEQTTSSMMPWFAVRDLKSRVPGFHDTSEDRIAQAIQTGVDRLLTMQTRDGGFAYWPGGKEPTTWASTYGGLALLLARENGASVPDASIDQLTDWLLKAIKKEPSTKETKAPHWNTSWEMETRVRALYVLALAGKPEVAIQNRLLDHTEYLNPSARAFLALAIHRSGGDKSRALGLLTDSRTRTASNHWMRHTSDQALQLLAWSEIFPNDKRVHTAMKKMLANRNPYGHWRTTWCNSWALQAMASYARNVEKTRSPSTIQLVTNGETKTLQLSETTPIQSLRIPLQKEMKLIVSSNNTCHANLKLSAKPQLAPTGPWAHDGLSLIRRYERVMADGTSQPMGQPCVGDLVKVSLDITFPDTLEYVVIEDRLPSLFEAVNNNFASQSAHIQAQSDNAWDISHKELRSDRAVFFIDRSWSKGTRTISYLARVTSAGTATAPAAKVEAMYEPERLALSKSQTMTTLKKETVVGK
jgi:uncharacterized protein YfaS (alpha-2-macroglobulin family)